jgi:hypothetical protein
MIFPLLYVLQVNEVVTIGYARSWIPRLDLETIGFLIVTFEYLQNYPHLGL